MFAEQVDLSRGLALLDSPDQRNSSRGSLFALPIAANRCFRFVFAVPQICFEMFTLLLAACFTNCSKSKSTVMPILFLVEKSLVIFPFSLYQRVCICILGKVER